MKEEDKLLLKSLGVTSANPDDIERDLLAKAKIKGQGSDISDPALEINGAELPDNEEQGQGNLLANRARIQTHLRAVEAEIAAVAAGLETVQNDSDKENAYSEILEGEEDKNEEELTGAEPFLADRSVLQRALANDRLKSLKRKRGQLKKQLKSFEGDGQAQESNEHNLLLVVDNKVADSIARFKETRSSVDGSPKKEKINPSLREDDEFDAVLDAAASGLVETERDKLIRTGVLTPFHQVKGFERRVQRFYPTRVSDQLVEDNREILATDPIAKATASWSAHSKARPSTKLLDGADLPKLDPPTRAFRRLRKPLHVKPSKEVDEFRKDQASQIRKRRRPLPDKQFRKSTSSDEEPWSDADGQESNGLADKDVLGKQKHRKLKQEGLDAVDPDYETEGNEEVIENIGNAEEDIVTVEGGLKIPGRIYDSLFDYQKTGVKWLWELHCQRAGGIIGDEMGLGKTIQVLAFLAALHFSGMYKPSIIICPVTLLRQWRREAQKWYPHFRIGILHDSVPVSSLKTNKTNGRKKDDGDEGMLGSDDEEVEHMKGTKKWDFLINRIVESKSGLLITSYEQLRLLREKLLDIQWGYAILDEGHRVRNPNAEITLVCKQLQTVHRIIMTGAPIQNKLTELWSLFDFVFPGKLGVLPIFEAQFAAPIAIGGYANATPLQVSTAYKCAVVLRDIIMPYLLRRMKTDVHAQLPKKTEHVLFCSLTEEQRAAYRAFLASSDVEQIFEGSRNSLYGIDILRKICNHPDLLERDHSGNHPDFGNPERSGKLKVVAQVLKVWKDEGHRVLIFTQTQQMLDIIENYLVSEGLNYRRMDGLTPVKQRMALMDDFNNSMHVFVFILTTRVGGLGTNLVGADRVIIFDPDWNPSTDTQARERAWRIGQTREVIIYRLITRGTIEEKVYHRQIYKHFLTNKILKNPQQRRFFKARDMRDLFTLQDDKDEDKTETSNIFSELTGEIKLGDQNVQHAQAQIPAAVQNESVITCGKRNTGKDKNMSRSKGKEKVLPREDESHEDESRMLKSLFEANGIHSAMDHDAIVDIDDEEKLRLDDEASQVAQKAAEALRQSRMLRGRDSVSVPTWTGRSGAAGAPAAVRRRFGSTVNSQLISVSKSTEGSGASTSQGSSSGLAGASLGKALSSGDLLARIRGNQINAIGAGLEHQMISGTSPNLVNGNQRPSSSERPSTNRAPPVSVQPEILIRQLCTFIQQNGGSSDSARIVEHFKDRVPSKDLSLFKKLLKEIATLTKEGGEGKWVLRPDYQIDKFCAS